MRAPPKQFLARNRMTDDAGDTDWLFDQRVGHNAEPLACQVAEVSQWCVCADCKDQPAESGTKSEQASKPASEVRRDAGDLP